MQFCLPVNLKQDLVEANYSKNYAQDEKALDRVIKVLVYKRIMAICPKMLHN